SYFYYPWISNYDYNSSLINNISLPKDYQRIDSEKNSFGEWLRHLPLKIDNTVYLHSGKKKYNQTAQFRVLDIDVGTRDLQQCADAVMRLRAEYLFASNQMDKIHFNYTNGIDIPFSKWSSGFYPSLKGNKVVWVSSSNNKSYKSFKKYINNIFMYAGTASLEKEMNQVELKEIKPGDVLIKGGFPGHAVIVVDVAINHSTNDKIFMLAQSYMPAQSIHVLRNNFSDLSPWYSISEIDEFINTPEWTFSVSELKRFKE
ncbi:MAG: DUF4846 domain-containing protein, partial [Vicingaceae bacterium]|nr:DUF4846 domain-containing protein [Vicingaceae bacterium]